MLAAPSGPPRAVGCAPLRCARCAVRVASTVVFANVLLGAFKLSIGVIASSMAVIADGVQSLACAVIGAFVATGMRLARRPVDGRFPHGYGKVEYLVSLAANAALFGLALFILASSIYLLAIGRSSPPRFIALPVAVVSVLGNYLMWRACSCAGRATGSAGLLANATQNHADMLSSVAVAASVAICLMGPSLYFFDALGAGVASVVILVEAAASWWSDLGVLLDRTLPAELLRRAERLAREIPAVQTTRFVRGYRVGRGVAVQIGIVVPPSVTVAAAQRAAAETRVRVMCALPAAADVAVYPYADLPRPVARRDAEP